MVVKETLDPAPLRSRRPRKILFHHFRTSQVSQPNRRDTSTASPQRRRSDQSTQIKLEEIASQGFDSIASKVLEFVDPSFEAFQIVARVHFGREFQEAFALVMVQVGVFVCAAHEAVYAA